MAKNKKFEVTQGTEGPEIVILSPKGKGKRAMAVAVRAVLERKKNEKK